MKNIKRSILTIIILSNVLLLFVILLALDYFYPMHFIKEAESALKTEAAFMDSEDESVEKDSFLNDNISFIFPDDNYDEGSSYSKRLIRAENEIREFDKNNQLSKDTCYRYKTKDGFYVLMLTVDETTHNEDSRLISYIDISPYFTFIFKLNWFLLAFFALELTGMCVIGWKLGEKIEKTQYSQKVFFQNSSHELKTPLMSIQGYAEGIQTGVLDAEHASGVIISETEHMSKLVEELLSISKIDADQMVLKKTPLDIREVLYDCMMDLESYAEMNQIKLLPEFTEKETMVSCDEEQLERALRNVISNAIRHGKKEIHVNAEIIDQKVKIQIIDDGPGIPDQEKAHVFERFYTGTAKQGGTGIGLSLASEIIRLHGGSIHVVDATANYAKNGDGSAVGDKSAKCQGAIFEILLPVIKK